MMDPEIEEAKESDFLEWIKHLEEATLIVIINII